jgi:hypothetical protein
MSDEGFWLARFEADGLLRRDGETAGLRTTKRWQGAMARAAQRLYGRGQEDLRAPIASALIELYGDDIDDESIAEAIQAMLPIEVEELAPN